MRMSVYRELENASDIYNLFFYMDMAAARKPDTKNVAIRRMSRMYA